MANIETSRDVGSAGWAIFAHDDETVRRLSELGGKRMEERVERATTESSALVKSYAKMIVHVDRGNLRSSLEAAITERGLTSVAEIGSPLVYAPIEELRDHPGTEWGSISLAEAASKPADSGGHAYLSVAMVRNVDAIKGFYAKAIGGL